MISIIYEIWCQTGSGPPTSPMSAPETASSMWLLCSTRIPCGSHPVWPASLVRFPTKSRNQRGFAYSAHTRMNGPSFSQSGPGFGCPWQTFSPACRHIRSIRLPFIPRPVADRRSSPNVRQSLRPWAIISLPNRIEIPSFQCRQSGPCEQSRPPLQGGITCATLRTPPNIKICLYQWSLL